MKKTEQHLEILKDISLLYELALGIGQSLDLRENCTQFVHLLLARLNLDYGAVWLHNELSIGKSRPTGGYHMAFASPERQAGLREIGSGHPLSKKLANESSWIISSQLPEYEDYRTEKKGKESLLIVFYLPAVGFLKLTTANKEGFTQLDLNKLQSVMGKFATSLSACLYHERSITDAEEKLVAQQLLRERDRQYRSLVENLNEGLIITGKADEILFANQQMSELCGYSIDEMSGRRAYELFLPRSEWPKFKEHLENRLLGQRATYEVVQYRKDGTPWHSRITASPHVDHNGTPIGTIGLVSDITRQKETEAEILSLARFPDENPSPVLRVSPEGRLLYANQKSKLLLDHWQVKIDQTLPHDVLVLLSEAHQKERLLFVGDRCFLFSATYFQESGYFNLYALDITERRNAEAALQESENRYRALVEDAGDIIYNADFKGNFTYVNPIAVKLTGFSEEELLEMNFVDLLAVEDFEETQEYYYEQFSQRKPSSYFEFRIKTKTGKLLWLGQRVQLHLKDQKVAGFSAVARDITTRREVELALQESEAFTRQVINTSLDAVVTIDDNGIITHWNAQAEKIFQWSAEEAIGQSLTTTIIPHQHRNGHSDGMKRYIKTGFGPVLNQRIELTALRKSGDEFPVEISISPLHINGKTIFSAFINDISARKRTQLELIEARQRAEESVRTKEMFLANMSHEIRTPLNAIIGLSRLLKATELSQHQLNRMGAIQDSANHLLHIINEILDFSKIEADKMEVENIGFQLNQLLKELEDGLGYRAEEKGLSLILDTDTLPETVFIGDPLRLKQVMLNLISNSLKFTEKGNIQVACRVLESNASYSHVRFEVKDTGIGIPPDKLEKIFDSFTQADPGTTRRSGGTGLGLAISRKLIRLMGGELAVTSEEGLGSTFAFEIGLKIGKAVDLPGAQKAKITMDVKGKHVLLVEDNHMNQVVATGTLEGLGISSDAVENGEMALQQLSKTQYDLVLMDLQMPVMGGLEATEIIRKELKLDIPIVGLSANAMKGDQERCLEAGMNGYLTKPFDPEDLHAAIASVLMSPASEETIPELPTKAENKPLPVSDGPVNYSVEQLKKMAGGNETFLLRMIRIFVEDTPADLDLIAKGIADENWQQVQQAAHSLKPSIDTMRIEGMSEVVRQLENCTDYEPEETQLHFSRFQKSVHRVIASLREAYLA